MGLLREGNNMAIRVLRTVGIDPKKLYSAVVKKINEAPRAAAAAGGWPCGRIYHPAQTPYENVSRETFLLEKNMTEQGGTPCRKN